MCKYNYNGIWEGKMKLKVLVDNNTYIEQYYKLGLTKKKPLSRRTLLRMYFLGN